MTLLSSQQKITDFLSPKGQLIWPLLFEDQEKWRVLSVFVAFDGAVLVVSEGAIMTRQSRKVVP
jgi:hypothetical protein